MVFYFINDLVSSRFKGSDFEPARSDTPGLLVTPLFFYQKSKDEKLSDPSDIEKYPFKKVGERGHRETQAR